MNKYFKSIPKRDATLLLNFDNSMAKVWQQNIDTTILCGLICGEVGWGSMTSPCQHSDVRKILILNN